MKTDKNELSVLDWQVILNFTLKSSSSKIVWDIVRRNGFINFSKKENIIEGARLSLYYSSHNFDNVKEDPQTLIDFLQFLKVPTKEAEVLMSSFVINKNRKEIDNFLKNHIWFER